MSKAVKQTIQKHTTESKNTKRDTSKNNIKIKYIKLLSKYYQFV